MFLKAKKTNRREWDLQKPEFRVNALYGIAFEEEKIREIFSDSVDLNLQIAVKLVNIAVKLTNIRQLWSLNGT